MNVRRQFTVLVFIATCLPIAGLAAAAEFDDAKLDDKRLDEKGAPYAIVLGVAQDAGFPQAACRKACCRGAWRDPGARRFAASLAIVDPHTKQRWLIDCTPDFRSQLRFLDEATSGTSQAIAPGLDGILLTHAHVGHYAGLIHLGREAIGAKNVSVFAMPRMKFFLETNGPWDQLTKLRQIQIKRMTAGQVVRLNARIKVTPFLVPHRDEYSETVGFLIEGPRRTLAYIPDIDKWERWSTPIETVIANADVAYLDATFYADGELPGRNIAEIPHPFVSESIARFKSLSDVDRNKVRFIHLNHTNPLLSPDSPAVKVVREAGHHVSRQGERQPL